MMTSDGWLVRANVIPRGEWSRRLHAPWRILKMSTNGGDTIVSDPVPYIEAAVSAFVKPPFPARATRMVIVDADSWIALGYSTDPEYISAVGHDCWMGSDFGFAVLEASGHIDPVDLAIWESWAREASDVEQWWT